MTKQMGQKKGCLKPKRTKSKITIVPGFLDYCSRCQKYQDPGYIRCLNCSNRLLERVAVEERFRVRKIWKLIEERKSLGVRRKAV